MADEALVCFKSLLESVPGWIADLDTILKAAAARQEELLFASRPEGTAEESVTRPSDRPSRTNSSSLKSHRSEEKKAGEEQNVMGSPVPPERPQLQHLTNSDALRLSQRKRKTASVCSGDHSGPSKYRQRAAAVVYYDGETQKQFEQLVRMVGSARNSIRKGKMSVKVDSLSRTGSSSSEASTSSGDENADFNVGEIQYRSSRSPRAFGRNDGTEVFDRVDARLEKGQALCERAAHQVLRDGDCALEVTEATSHLTEALTMVKAEIPSLQRKAEKAAERRRRSEERHRTEEHAEEVRRSRLSEQVRNATSQVTYAAEGKLDVDQLEVDDDSDDDDGEFNLSSIQFAPLSGKTSQLRSASTRLAAQA